MGIIVNLIDKQYSRLTVKRRSVLKATDGKPLWWCLCSCGNYTTAKTVELNNGQKKSCGCLRFDCMTNYKHGQGSNKSKTKEYIIWQGIIQRTTNPNAPAYKWYGGRGIKTSKQWSEFVNFFNDMGRCPGNNYSIDRINNDKEYSKSNCRWATMFEQQRNRSNNRWLEFGGQKLIMKDWAVILKTSPTNILYHLKLGKTFPSVYKFYLDKQRRDV